MSNESERPAAKRKKTNLIESTNEQTSVANMQICDFFHLRDKLQSNIAASLQKDILTVNKQNVSENEADVSCYFLRDLLKK